MATDIASKEPETFRAGVANGFKSRRSIVSEAGGDFENTIEEIAQDNAIAEVKGVELDGDRAEAAD